MINPIKWYHAWNLNRKQADLNKKCELYGPTEEVLDEQLQLNIKRNKLDIPDKSKIVNDEGYVQ